MTQQKVKIERKKSTNLTIEEKMLPLYLFIKAITSYSEYPSFNDFPVLLPD